MSVQKYIVETEMGTHRYLGAERKKSKNTNVCIREREIERESCTSVFEGVSWWGGGLLFKINNLKNKLKHCRTASLHSQLVIFRNYRMISNNIELSHTPMLDNEQR